MTPTLARPADPVAQQIATRRRALGLSQPILATLASVSMMVLSKAERGIGRQLRRDEVARLDLVLARLEAVRAEAAQLTA
jgi:hypothetical protein